MPPRLPGGQARQRAAKRPLVELVDQLMGPVGDPGATSRRRHITVSVTSIRAPGRSGEVMSPVYVPCLVAGGTSTLHVTLAVLRGATSTTVGSNLTLPAGIVRPSSPRRPAHLQAHRVDRVVAVVPHVEGPGRRQARALRRQRQRHRLTRRAVVGGGRRSPLRARVVADQGLEELAELDRGAHREPRDLAAGVRRARDALAGAAEDVGRGPASSSARAVAGRGPADLLAHADGELHDPLRRLILRRHIAPPGCRGSRSPAAGDGWPACGRRRPPPAGRRSRPPRCSRRSSPLSVQSPARNEVVVAALVGRAAGTRRCPGSDST